MIRSYLYRAESNQELPADRAYAFYSCLLSQLPEEYAEALHAQGETPISQYLYRENGETYWRISLLDRPTDELLSPILGELKTLSLHAGDVSLERKESRSICAEELIAAARAIETERFSSLRFLSPAAFKQNGGYVVLPNVSLILQSLMNKWNTVFPEIPLEDEDAFRMLSEGIKISDYNLRTTRFLLKDNRIPGFVGSLRLDARLAPPLMELWKILLVFSKYSGVGIKTALGMGGVKRIGV